MQTCCRRLVAKIIYLATIRTWHSRPSADPWCRTSCLEEADMFNLKRVEGSCSGYQQHRPTTVGRYNPATFMAYTDCGWAAVREGRRSLIGGSFVHIGGLVQFWSRRQKGPPKVGESWRPLSVKVLIRVRVPPSVLARGKAVMMLGLISSAPPAQPDYVDLTKEGACGCFRDLSHYLESHGTGQNDPGISQLGFSCGPCAIVIVFCRVINTTFFPSWFEQGD